MLKEYFAVDSIEFFNSKFKLISVYNFKFRFISCIKFRLNNLMKIYVLNMIKIKYIENTYVKAFYISKIPTIINTYIES